MQHPQEQLELDGRGKTVETETDVVDDRGREQRGDARRRPQLVRGAQFVVQPQAGVALPHRRHLGSGAKKEGILDGHFMKAPKGRKGGGEDPCGSPSCSQAKMAAPNEIAVGKAEAMS